MTMTRRTLLGLYLFATLSVAAWAGGTSCYFVVDCRDTESGVLKVSMTFQEYGDAKFGDQVVLFMPTWTPGAYRKVNHGEQVRNLVARDGRGNECAVEHVDGWRWLVDTRGVTHLDVTYEVKSRGLTSSHCSFTGTEVFLGVEGQLGRPALVHFENPEGWKIATGMRPQGSQSYHVPTYDDLVDCPVEIGEFDLYELDIQGVAVEVVVHTAGDVEGAVREFLLPRIEAIFDYELTLMQDKPFDRYVFLFHIRDRGMGGGGLEHMNSTAISLTSASLTRGDSGASVIAHELFHAWNVKRIRSAPIRPYDYSDVPKIDSLWFHEGVTSYYAALTLRRTGITTEPEFLGEIARCLANLDTTQDYYSRGEALGFLLDCQIRAATGNERSLDDVFRYMNWAYGKPEVPFQESEEIGRIVSGFAGIDLTDFVREVAVGQQPADLATLCSLAGFRFELDSGTRTPYLGVYAEGAEAGGVNINQVVPGTSAATAGLKRGDRIVSWGGKDLGPRDWPRAVRESTPGEHYELVVARGDEQVTLDLELGYQERLRGKLALDPDAAEDRAAIARSLLQGEKLRPVATAPTPPPAPTKGVVPAEAPAEANDWF